jgi:molybdate transport system ATP-binding protein
MAEKPTFPSKPLILWSKVPVSFPEILTSLGDPWAALPTKEWGRVSHSVETQVLEVERQNDMSDFMDRPDPGRSAREWVEELGPLKPRQESWARGLGWYQFAQRGLKHLSTGEWRKTMLVRSLFKEWLFWVDPLEGLDAESKAFYREEWVNLSFQHKLIAVFVHRTHIPQGNDYSIWDGNQILPMEHLPPSPIEKEPKKPQLIDAEKSGSWAAVADFPGIHVAYQDGSQILTDVHWSFRRGEKWLLTGPNGSGKTTLARLLVGDHPQVFGQGIRLFDRLRGSGETLWEIRRHFGFVSTALQNQFRFSEKVSKVILSGFFDSVGIYQTVTQNQRNTMIRLLEQFGSLDLQELDFQKISLGPEAADPAASGSDQGSGGFGPG